jgi:hypothetical protein
MLEVGGSGVRKYSMPFTPMAIGNRYNLSMFLIFRIFTFLSISVDRDVTDYCVSVVAK